MTNPLKVLPWRPHWCQWSMLLPQTTMKPEMRVDMCSLCCCPDPLVMSSGFAARLSHAYVSGMCNQPPETMLKLVVLSAAEGHE